MWLLTGGIDIWLVNMRSRKLQMAAKKSAVIAVILIDTVTNWTYRKQRAWE